MKRLIFSHSPRQPWKYFLVLSSCLVLQNALAGQPDTLIPVVPLSAFPYAPGVTVAGLFGDVTTGWADVMAPIAGNPNIFWHIDPQFLYHSGDQYSASVGTGFRALTDTAGILGAYVFGDYNHSEHGNSFWFVSPGIERLGEVLDFSVNAYIPVGTQRVNNGTTWASEVGVTQFVEFSGHDQFDQLATQFESTGIGVDGEIGYRLPFLPNSTKLYLGGYYFSPKDSDSITGGTVRIEAPVTNFISITVSDAYDNIYHNTFKAGVSLALGGRSTHFTDYNLENRLVDPIQRNRVAIEGGSPTSQYIAEDLDFSGEEALMLSNIWFFSPTGAPVAPSATPVSLSQCTYEHPCSSNDVNSDFFAGINAVSPNAIMYLAPGNYNNINGELAVNDGQSMYGRTADYTQSAKGSFRPLLTGGLDLFGNNVIDSLQLINDSVYTQMQAVLIEDDAKNVVLNNLLIGNSSNRPGETYRVGVQIGNRSEFTMTNSEINVFDDTATGQTIAGIKVNGDNNKIYLAENNIRANGEGDVRISGISNEGSENIWTIEKNQINVANPSSIGNNVYGIFSMGSNNLWSVFSNKISSSVTGTLGFAQTDGIFSNDTLSTWNISGNRINVNCQAGSFCITNGINFQGDEGNLWKITNNQFNITTTSNANQVSGVNILNPGNDTSLKVNNNIINVTVSGVSSQAYGVHISGFSTIDNDIFSIENNLINVSGLTDSIFLQGIDNEIFNTATNITYNINNNSINLDGSSLLATGIDNTIFGSADNIKINIKNNRITNNNANMLQGINSQFLSTADNISETIYGNRITVNADGGNGNAIGINSSFGSAVNNSSVNISNNKMTLNGTRFASGIQISSFGDFDNDNIEISNNQISASGTGTSGDSRGILFTLPELTNSSVNIQRNSVNVDAQRFATGIEFRSSNPGDNDKVSILNNQIHAKSVGDVTGSSVGIESSAEISNSTVKISGNFVKTESLGDGFASDGMDVFITGINDQAIISSNSVKSTATSSATGIRFEQNEGEDSSLDFYNNKIVATIFGESGDRSVAFDLINDTTDSVYNVHHNYFEASSSADNSTTIGVLDEVFANTEVVLKNNTIKATSSGDNSEVHGLDFSSLNSNNLTVKNNLIIASASGDFSTAIGMLSENNDFITGNVSENVIAAFTSGESSNAAATKFISGFQNTWNFSHNLLIAKTTGDNSDAAGMDLAGESLTFTSTQDKIIVKTIGENSSAFGIVNGADQNLFNSTITLTNDKMNISSRFGDAYGVFDLDPTNTWSIVGTIPNIKVSAPNGIACKVKLAGDPFPCP